MAQLFCHQNRTQDRQQPRPRALQGGNCKDQTGCCTCRHQHDRRGDNRAKRPQCRLPVVYPRPAKQQRQPPQHLGRPDAGRRNRRRRRRGPAIFEQHQHIGQQNAVVQHDQTKHRRHRPKHRPSQGIAQRARLGLRACQPKPLTATQLANRKGVDRNCPKQDQRGKGQQGLLPAHHPSQNIAQGKGQRARQPRHKGHAGDRATRACAQTAGNKGKARLIKAPGLSNANNRPGQQPRHRRGRIGQPRHTRRRQYRRIGQHLAAKTTIHQAPGKGRQHGHDQKCHRRTQCQLGHTPPRCRPQIWQQGRKGVIHPGIGQGLADRQQPNRRISPLGHSR